MSGPLKNQLAVLRAEAAWEGDYREGRKGSWFPFRGPTGQKFHAQSPSVEALVSAEAAEGSGRGGRDLKCSLWARMVRASNSVTATEDELADLQRRFHLLGQSAPSKLPPLDDLSAAKARCVQSAGYGRTLECVPLDLRL